ncbi:MAG: 2-hydroxyacid dehydrogenase [Telmatospirillum sp.]|nr:2-hydroxyacid dehydrogenase [Telmatospirillum sp.]
MAIPLLVLIETAPDAIASLTAAGFDPHQAPTTEDRSRLFQTSTLPFRAVLTNGSTGLTAEEMDSLPDLEIVCAQGAGYERIDLEAAKRRGLVVTHGPGTNDISVADHALALMLSIARDIPGADRTVRAGGWRRARHPRPGVTGKRLGILGLGRIGSLIARRGSQGFDMPVAYHNRHPREGAPYLFLNTVRDLADWADFLVVATPGGPETRHLVDDAILNALGPRGFLINIARGSVVDTEALIDALRTRRLGGAALDVLDGEPEIPPGISDLDTLILTPHIAGRSPEAIAAITQLVVENLSLHFSGQPPKTPVPALLIPAGP